MTPAIARSITSGFRAANRSWAGIGFFTGCWLLIIVIIMLALAMTKPPLEALEEPAPAIPSAAATLTPPAAPSTTSEPSAEPTTDLFQQMTDAANAVPDSSEVVEDVADVLVDVPAGDASDAQETARQAEQARAQAVSAWVGRCWPVLVILFLFFLVTSLWLYGGQTGYLAVCLRAGTASVSEFWKVGTRALRPLLGASMLSFGGALALVLLGGLLAGILVALLAALPNWLGASFSVVGLLALLCAAVWIMVKLSFWFVAIVIDQRGPIGGLRVSWRLTRGQGWRILGLLLVLGLMNVGAWLVFRLLVMVVGASGLIGAILALILTLVYLVASLFYLGFVGLGAYIQFYEDAKATMPAASTSSATANA